MLVPQLLQDSSFSKREATAMACSDIDYCCKAGLFADHVKDAITLQDIGRQSNLDTSAYSHQDLVHAWHAEQPEMFAQTCKSWVEKGKVLEEFKKL